MKPTGFVEVKSEEILPKLKAMYEYVEVYRYHRFAEMVNRRMDKKIGWFWNRRKRTLQESWDYVLNDDWGYLLEPNDQLYGIKGLIDACALSETILINVDVLFPVTL